MFNSQALIVLLSLTTIAACTRESTEAPATSRSASTSMSPPTSSDNESPGSTRVRTETVAEGTAEGRLVVTATVQPVLNRVAQVVPRVPGRVLQVLAHFGEPVKRGQALAMLDSLEVGDARLALRQARIQSELADAEYARIAPLVAEEVLPRKDIVRAAAERDRARATAETARQRLRMLGIDPSESRDETGIPSSFPLIAPLSGVVLNELAIVGELANSDRNLFTVGDLSRVWVEGNLTDRQIALVRVGASAEVMVEAYPGEVFRGKVTYLSGTLDAATRTLLARVEIANPDLRLKPQMFARMAILAGDSRPQFTVPTSAVVLVQGESSVFVVDGDGFTPRPVDTGEVVGDRIVIRAGLVAGDRVAVTGVFDLKAKLLKSQISDED